NNIIAAGFNTPAIRINKAYSLNESDYNNLFTTSPLLYNYVGNIGIDVNGWKSITNKDAHSLGVNPMYNGSDLHICVNELNGAGIALLYVTKDIDLRASTPDIGADEFLGDVNDLLLEDEYSICPNSFVTIGNVPMTGVTYSWSSGENSSEITVNSAGEYVVVASNLCGSYSDTNHVIYKPSAVADFSIVNSVGIAITLENNSLNAISYLWNLGDGNSSTDFELSYIYAAEGNYVIELTAYGECDTVITTQIYEAIALSTEVFENGEILLYPNPASE